MTRKYSMLILLLTTMLLSSCDTMDMPYRPEKTYTVNRAVEPLEPFTPLCTLDRGDENSWTQFPDYHDREKYLPIRGASPIAVHYGEIRIWHDDSVNGIHLFFSSDGWGCLSHFPEEWLSIDVSVSQQRRSVFRTGNYNLNLVEEVDTGLRNLGQVRYRPLNDDALGPPWIQDTSFENRFSIHAETDSTMTVSFSAHVIRENPEDPNWTHPQNPWQFIPLRLHIWMEPTEVRLIRL